MNPQNSSADSGSTLEERRLLIEERRLALESSFARKWFPTLATLVVGLVATVFGVVQGIDAVQATKQANNEAKLKNDREWGVKVVEIYFEQRELFDLTTNPTQALANIKLIATVAPEAVQGLLNAEQSLIPGPGEGEDDSKRLTSLAAIAEVQAAIAPADTKTPTSQALHPSTFVVYIQYPEGQREKALAAQATLQKLGYRAPGIEKLANVPSRMQVRYYRPEQQHLAGELARTIGATLQLPITTGNAVQVVSQKQLPNGILELWLPQNTQW